MAMAGEGPPSSGRLATLVSVRCIAAPELEMVTICNAIGQNNSPVGGGGRESYAREDTENEKPCIIEGKLKKAGRQVHYRGHLWPSHLLSFSFSFFPHRGKACVSDINIRIRIQTI